MSEQSRKLGFTLIELLVVISIIGVLTSLILPAVNVARESARRVSCVNNQKQIGLALHGYCEARSVFPAAWVGFDKDNRPAPSGPTGWGWGAALLPYMEQANLQDEYIDYTKAVCHPDNAKALNFRLKIFICPSDASEEKFFLDRFLMLTKHLHDNSHVDHSHDEIEFAFSSYVASFGSTDFAEVKNVSPGEKFKSNGAFFHNSFLPVATFTDGLGNTILLGERSSFTGYATWSGIPEGDECHPALLAGTSLVKYGRQGGHWSGFSSNHPGGGNFAMGDGSVHFFNDTIDMEVFQALSTRNGGEVVSLP